LVEIRQIEPHLVLALLDLKVFSSEHPELLKRDLEKRGTETLLKALFKGEVGLYHDEHNKPHIKQGGHISISHSHDLMGILYNGRESTGLDIELLRDKVLAIQHKFLNEHEKAWAANDVETLVSFWAIKESLYKVFGKKGTDFRKHLFIEEYRQNPILASIRMNGLVKRYELVKEKVKDYILVYVSKEL